MATIEKAIEIALDAHRGQVDRAGQPYILHPLRLMAKMPTKELMIIALLHDVVEDSRYTLEDLRREGFSENIIKAVDSLTMRNGEKYDDYIRRAKQNALAVPVKLADLEDNMNIRRLQQIGEKDTARLQKYLNAYHFLTDA